jgi:hypothetical protein
MWMIMCKSWLGRVQAGVVQSNFSLDHSARVLVTMSNSIYIPCWF